MEQPEKRSNMLKMPPVPKIFIETEIYDKDDNLVLKEGQDGHSWTRNYYNMVLFHQFGYSNTEASFGVGHASLKLYSGTIGGTYFAAPPMMIPGVAASSSYGIVVGTGVNAFSEDQYAMGTLVTHGTSANQLYYQVQQAHDVSYGSVEWSITMARSFINLSGSTINITETGIIGVTAGLTNATLFERSLCDVVKEVLDGYKLTVRYVATKSFSGIDD